MEFSVTDSAGRKVAVKARNWLFAIASGLRALEVDANTLTSVTCNYEPDGSIVVEAPGGRRWWVKSLAAQLPFDAGSLPVAPMAPPTPPTPARPASRTKVAPRPQPFDASRPNPVPNSNPPYSPMPLEREIAPSAEPIAFEDEDALATERTDPGSPVRASAPRRRGLDVSGRNRHRPDSIEPDLVEVNRVTQQPSRAPVTPIAPQRAAASSQQQPASLTAPRHVDQDIRVVVSARSRLLDDEDSLWDTVEERTPDNVVADMSQPAPAFEMPRSSLIREEPESLAERLFEASMDFIGAERDEACQIALELVNEFVSCQASSIALGTLNDRELTFVAATGPVADQIQGSKQPFGKGLVGMCFDLRSTLVVTDVKQSAHHDGAFDQQTGFDTHAALCVPILDDEGLAYGVIQLLNPTGQPFFDEDEEAVETIARALAGALAFS